MQPSCLIWEPACNNIKLVPVIEILILPITLFVLAETGALSIEPLLLADKNAI